VLICGILDNVIMLFSGRLSNVILKVAFKPGSNLTHFHPQKKKKKKKKNIFILYFYIFTIWKPKYKNCQPVEWLQAPSYLDEIYSTKFSSQVTKVRHKIFV
jgi:hypothetical protein